MDDYCVNDLGGCFIKDLCDTVLPVSFFVSRLSFMFQFLTDQPIYSSSNFTHLCSLYDLAFGCVINKLIC
jgi:hypothetical protein